MIGGLGCGCCLGHRPKKVSKSAAGAAAAPVVSIETEEERRIKEVS